MGDAMIGGLIEDLIRDESMVLKPYRDSVGKLTIGVGRNLEDVGITENEATYLLTNDLASVERDLDRNASWWRAMSVNRQRALANMCFNLGWPRLREFRMMLSALESEDWEAAAEEALNSKWAKQVGERAHRIADLIRGG